MAAAVPAPEPQSRLDMLRARARTRYMKDPAKLQELRGRAQKVARKTLLERKIVTPSDLAAIEADTEGA